MSAINSKIIIGTIREEGKFTFNNIIILNIGFTWEFAVKAEAMQLAGHKYKAGMQCGWYELYPE